MISKKKEVKTLLDLETMKTTFFTFRHHRSRQFLISLRAVMSAIVAVLFPTFELVIVTYLISLSHCLQNLSSQY